MLPGLSVNFLLFNSFSGLPGGPGRRLLDEVTGSSDGESEAADGSQTHLYQL